MKKSWTPIRLYDKIKKIYNSILKLLMMHKYIKYLIWISNSFFSASLIAFSKIKLLYVLKLGYVDLLKCYLCNDS